MDTQYRATVYLKQEIDTGKVTGIPVLHTSTNEDKSYVLNFCKKLLEQNIIQAYLICAS